jgi:hypothetical protein
MFQRPAEGRGETSVVKLWIHDPGASPAIVSYNASSGLVHFENKKIFSSTLKKRSSLLCTPLAV